LRAVATNNPTGLTPLVSATRTAWAAWRTLVARPPRLLEGLLLLALLALALIAAAASNAVPGATYTAADPAATRALARFHGVEQNATDTYRWSNPAAAIFLYGYEGHPAIATLRLTAPRPDGQTPAEVRVLIGEQPLGSFTVVDAWRRYHILTPTARSGESALRLETAPFTPPDDPRELGLALSWAVVEPTTLAGGPQPVRSLYLAGLPLIGLLLLHRLRTSGWTAFVFGVLLATLAGWAAAFPTLSGYWLPTLGWPWVPALPLLILGAWPRLTPAFRAARAALDARPALGWAGLAVALAAVVGMRGGLPWPVGMGLLAAGVWAGLGLARTDDTLDEGVELPLPLLLLGVVGAALALRLYNLGEQPAGLWRDESRHGLQALRIWSDPEYRPVYVVEGADLPALLFYLMAPVVGIFGPEAWSARLVSAVAGGLTPLAIYWAGSPLVGRRAALLAAALAAWASWSLSMSRWAFPATLDHLLVLTAAGLVWRCAPRSGPRAVAGMAVAGLLGGLAVYAYHTGRVAPLALAAVAALRLGPTPAAWRRALPGLAVAALTGALTIAPLAGYILGDLDGYNRRVGNVSVFDSVSLTTRTPVGLFLDNLSRYLLMFHVQGDGNGRHHMPDAPMLDPAAGLLLALGLGGALATARRQAGIAAVLALGTIYLIPGVFSGNAPHAMRSLGVLAPAALLAGLGLAGLLRGLPPAGVRRLPWRAALCASALLASLAFNGWLYFGAMRAEPAVYGEFDLLETAVGRVAAAPARSTDPALGAVRVYLPEKLLGRDTVQFLTWGLPTHGYTGAPLPADGPALILLPGDASAAAQTGALAALGPGATALGPVVTYPGSAEPAALAFGRGEAAARLLEEARR
jgi:4-amino-4-deoxy-L-arabinose transferase-like glycosyltransferase